MCVIVMNEHDDDVRVDALQYSPLFAQMISFSTILWATAK